MIFVHDYMARCTMCSILIIIFVIEKCVYAVENDRNAVDQKCGTECMYIKVLFHCVYVRFHMNALTVA